MQALTIISHPLIAHKMTLMRDRRTSTGSFRRLVRELSMLMAYEVLRDLPLAPVEIETPVAPITGEVIAGKKLCFVSVLRAGDGLLHGLLDLVPAARVGHIGLYRDPETLKPVRYYAKLPDHMEERLAIIVDPMLATGGSAAAAVAEVKEAGARDIRFLTLVAAPEGVEVLHAAHPELPIFTAALDEGLTEAGYIIPGLGDAGDRLFGTK